jgi:FKBP-type peptidyl-prolyl cis-trans isomerase 2
MIQNGNKVKVHYTGKTNGEIFDSSEGREPIEFVVGSKQVIEGFENAVIGKNIGDEIVVEIPPSEGYGESKDDLIISVAKDQVPPDAQIGQTLQGVDPEGMPFNVMVSDIQDDVVILDLNHPLSGKTLQFTISIVSFE